MAWDTSQPRNKSEKRKIASSVLEGAATHPPRPTRDHGGKLHRLSVTAAENGVSVEHTVKHFNRSQKQHGARDTQVNPSDSGPWGPDTTTKTHVLNNDHPMMAHLNALHEHFSSASDEDGDED